MTDTTQISNNQLAEKVKRLDQLESAVNKTLDGVTSAAKDPGWLGLIKAGLTFIVFIMAQSIISKINSDCDKIAKEAYEAGQTSNLNHGNNNNQDG